jgi:hypothetical protein
VWSFIDDLKSYGFVLDQKQYGQIINTLMKANMADHLFDANIGAQLRGTLDPMLEKVLEIEKNPVRLIYPQLYLRSSLRSKR